MVFNLSVDTDLNTFVFAYVVADSKEAALDKLGLAKMPENTYLTEATEVANFDQMAASLEKAVGSATFRQYDKLSLESAKK